MTHDSQTTTLTLAPSTPDPQPQPARCEFTFADGRRCRSPRAPGHPSFCLRHAPPQHPRLPATLSPETARELAALPAHFPTACALNRALGKLFSLTAQGRLPRRDALTLAYLARTILGTLPLVRREIIAAHGHDAWHRAIHAAFLDPPREPR